MATIKKKKTSRRDPFRTLPEPFRQYLLLGIKGDPTPQCDEFEIYLFRYDRQRQEASWEQYRDELMAEWLKDYPGTRPFAWWEYDAPRQPLGTHEGWSYDGKLPEPRLMISGTGKTMSKSYFKWGVPYSWYSIDEQNVPTFEAEASYLKRFGLLTKDEEKRLQEEDFQPQTIYDI